MNNVGPNCLDAQCCRGDFYLMLRDAIVLAGGAPCIVEEWTDRPLREIVDLLAQNGIQMVYLPHKHIDPQGAS